MKKLLAFAALFAVVALTSCKYDDDDLLNSVHGLENRVAKLEELCKQMNTNISSLQTIVTALQKQRLCYGNYTSYERRQRNRLYNYFQQR